MSSTSHLGGSGPNGDPATHMPDVWGYVCYKYNLHSVLDIGCALGFNAVWFHNRGFDVLGVEGLPDYVRHNKLPPERVVMHDYTRGPWVPPKVYDLGLCIEVVEHIEAQFVPNFVATFQRCEYVLMTNALPNQGGYHHVNEQPIEYWIDVMRKSNFTFFDTESELLRSTHTGDYHYGRNTLSLFKNNAPQ